MSRPRSALRRLSLAAVMVAPLVLGGCSMFGRSTVFGGKPEDPLHGRDPSTVSPEVIYNHGIDALRSKDYAVAVKQFDLVEEYYPYSSWATNAQLMEGYTEYERNHYTDAISALDRFIQIHPANKDIAYVYYLRALCYYEQIADISRDQKGTQDAMNALQEVVTRFPDSAYARDARLKIDLCRDHLAGKEMLIGRWYESHHLYAAAIGRYQTVVEDYQTTNHVPEALHRLVEIYLLIGLPQEARRTAAVLGHNYPGSVWYEDSWNQLLADKDIKGKPIGQADNAPGFFSRIFSIF